MYKTQKGICKKKENLTSPERKARKKSIHSSSYVRKLSQWALKRNRTKSLVKAYQIVSFINFVMKMSGACESMPKKA